MVKIKGKFTSQSTQVTDPFVLEVCAQSADTWHSRSEKLRLFQLYMKYNKTPNLALSEDIAKYQMMSYAGVGKWLLRIGTFSALGGFYSWFATWGGVPTKPALLLIPATVMVFSYFYYRLDRTEYYKVMERHEPQMTKWLCAHIPKT